MNRIPTCSQAAARDRCPYNSPMSQPHGEITHVSDTALMVAACRALEAECEDGFVHDPFAARLAGERGMAILRNSPRPDMMRFGIAVRSRFLDDLLLETLASDPVAVVLSIGCGLDTRPWRLALPPDLRWIEVDFPDMLDYKDSLMASEKPHCRRERLTADITDPGQRNALYAMAGPEPGLMITEGLLMYLPAATVDALAAESAQKSGVRQWIADVTTSTFAKVLNMDMSHLRKVQAEDWLHGEEMLEIMQRHGWSMAARRSYLTDMAFAMERIRRLFGAAPEPQQRPPIPLDDPTGVLRFVHSATPSLQDPR